MTNIVQLRTSNSCRVITAQIDEINMTNQGVIGSQRRRRVSPPTCRKFSARRAQERATTTWRPIRIGVAGDKYLQKTFN